MGKCFILPLRVRAALNLGLPQPQPVLDQPGCCLKKRPIILNRRVSLALLLEGKHKGPTLQQEVEDSGCCVFPYPQVQG